MTYMLHQNGIRKLIVLNNKNKNRLRADYTFERQTEYFKDTFCIAIETIIRKFFLILRG